MKLGIVLDIKQGRYLCQITEQMRVAIEKNHDPVDHKVMFTHPFNLSSNN